MKLTEGLESNELSVKLRLVSQLPEYGYNKGAMLAAAHLLSESDACLKTAAGECAVIIILYTRYCSRFRVMADIINNLLKCR